MQAPRDRNFGSPKIVALAIGQRCDNSFQRFLPLTDIGQDIAESDEEFEHRMNEDDYGFYAEPACFLDDSWDWETIESVAKIGPGHECRGRRYQAITEIFVRAAYDLENSLLHAYPDIVCSSVADFFTSAQVFRHLESFAQLVQHSGLARTLAGSEAINRTHDALEFICDQLSRYAQHVRPTVVRAKDSNQVQHLETCRKESKALLDKYRAQFPEETIFKRDIRWAAGGQDKKHFWLWENCELPDGSTPDTTIRHLLNSGKRPSEYRREKRPPFPDFK